MSIYIQEVLGLLRRNKKKIKLDKMRDHFEFGKLYQSSKLNTGASYNPTMEPFVVKFGDLVCEITEDLTRTQVGSGNLGYVPVYTNPEGSCSWDTIKDSIITQNAIADTITIGGKLKIVTVDQDDTLVQILVRDPAAGGEVKFRDAASIIPATGFDTLPMSISSGWVQTKLNAYVNLDDTTVPYINIEGMVNLTDGVEGCVIAKNIKTGSVLADDVIRFPNGWVGTTDTFINEITWTQGVDNGYPTSGLLFGESIKFNYITYQVPSTTNSILQWDACCKASSNSCPVATDSAFTIDEDTSLSNQVIVTDDGFGSYPLTYTVVTQPTNGTVSFDTTTGTYTYTPTANYFGVDSFTFSANDGYCDSNIATVTITVLAVADNPSIDTACTGTSQLNPGDVYTYNGTVSDNDTACNLLTMSLVSVTPAAPSWLNLVYNNDCTFTLSGTYPAAGGIFNAVIEVTDGNTTDQQSCNIAGLVPNIDTYFVFWYDTSGSITETIRQMGEITSAPVIYSTFRAAPNDYNPGISGPFYFENSTGGNGNQYVTQVDGLAKGSWLFIRPGMLASNTVGGVDTGLVPAGTVVTSAVFDSVNQRVEVFFNNNIDMSAGMAANGVFKFELDDALQAADYASPSNLRNLLQDFYVTSGFGTKASGNNDPTTNGQDQFNSHVYTGVSSEEEQVQMLYNKSEGLSNAAGQVFDGADQVIIMGMGDEAATRNGPAFANPCTNSYYGNFMNPPFNQDIDQPNVACNWSNRTASTNTGLVNDVLTLKSNITTITSQTGGSSGVPLIYRGMFLNIGSWDATLAPGSPGATPSLANQMYMEMMDLMHFGANADNGASFYTDADTLRVLSSGTNPTITYRPDTFNAGLGLLKTSTGGTNDQNPGLAYYYNEVRNGLNAMGFTL